MSEMIDLSLPNARRQLAESLTIDVDTYSKKRAEEPRRKHLGASQIGEQCSRRLWYDFRWAKREDFSGPMYRLFERGHLEEKRFYDYLVGIGCRFDRAFEDNQAHFSDLEGHFGGSMDLSGYLPERYGLADKVLFEFKTMNDKKFSLFKKQGVKLSHPGYWSQFCTYGYKQNIKVGCFCAVNKNTDEWGIEIHQIDFALGKYCIDKARNIITAPTSQPPPKFSFQATNFVCKWCHFAKICHHNEAVDINCRSCMNSVPMAEGKWGCTKFNCIIPEEIIEKGCNDHEGIHRAI